MSESSGSESLPPPPVGPALDSLPALPSYSESESRQDAAAGAAGAAGADGDLPSDLDELPELPEPSVSSTGLPPVPEFSNNSHSVSVSQDGARGAIPDLPAVPEFSVSQASSDGGSMDLPPIPAFSDDDDASTSALEAGGDVMHRTISEETEEESDEEGGEGAGAGTRETDHLITRPKRSHSTFRHVATCQWIYWPDPWQITDSHVFKPFVSAGGRQAFVGYRGGVALWSVLILIYALVNQTMSSSFWTIKITGVAYLMTMSYFVLSTYWTIQDTLSPRVRKENTFLRKLTIFLFITAFSWSLVVTVMYWSFVYGTKFDSGSLDFHVVNVHTHGVSFVWLAADLVFNKLEFNHTLLLMMMPFTFLYLAGNAAWVSSKAGASGSANEYTGGVWLSIFVGIVGAFYFGHLLTMFNKAERERPDFGYIPTSASGRSLHNLMDVIEEEEDEEQDDSEDDFYGDDDQPREVAYDISSRVLDGQNGDEDGSKDEVWRHSYVPADERRVEVEY